MRKKKNLLLVADLTNILFDLRTVQANCQVNCPIKTEMKTKILLHHASFSASQNMKYNW